MTHNSRRHPKSILFICGLAILLSSCTKQQDTNEIANSPYEIESASSPIPLNPRDEDEIVLGHFVYRGGFELSSPSAHFGGLSGLMVSPDLNRFVAVTDKGHWVRGGLQYEDGELIGAESLELAPLLDPDGKALLSKEYADAESLTGKWPKGESAPNDVFVSFESHHRIWKYSFGGDGFDARAEPVKTQRAFEKLQNNGGLEGILALPSENLKILAFAEEPKNGSKTIPGWLIGEGEPAKLGLVENTPFKVTDLGRLPSGDILTLERRFSPLGGVGASIRRLDQGQISEGAILAGQELIHLSAPYSVDNMEGLSVQQDSEGRTLIFIVSDDNFNALQRTIFMMFELKSNE